MNDYRFPLIKRSGELFKLHWPAGPKENAAEEPMAEESMEGGEGSGEEQ